MIFERRRYARDNYLYLLAEGADAALVDPGDPAAALELCRELGVRPRAVLHTHGHADHTGGTAEVKARLGAPAVRVYGHGADAGGYRPDEDLASRSELTLGALQLRIHHTPGHTPGSVLLEWSGRLLTGDTLFWGGCGNCRHGGDPAQLARSFLGPIAALDGGLLVNPGHDYAEPNLPFAIELAADGGAARERLEAVRAAHAQGREPDAVTLAEERAVNPFTRPWDFAAALAARGARCATPEEAFVALRALRDRW